MPQVQYASCESSILAPHARAQKTNDEIGILQTPTDKGVIEAVDAIEIAARHSQVAGLRAVPTYTVQLAQRAERQMHRRRQTIDAAAQPLAQESGEIPHLRRQSLRQNGRG